MRSTRFGCVASFATFWTLTRRSESSWQIKINWHDLSSMPVVTYNSLLWPVWWNLATWVPKPCLQVHHHYRPLRYLVWHSFAWLWIVDYPPEWTTWTKFHSQRHHSQAYSEQLKCTPFIWIHTWWQYVTYQSQHECSPGSCPPTFHEIWMQCKQQRVYPSTDLWWASVLEH